MKAAGTPFCATVEGRASCTMPHYCTSPYPAKVLTVCDTAMSLEVGVFGPVWHPEGGDRAYGTLALSAGRVAVRRPHPALLAGRGTLLVQYCASQQHTAAGTTHNGCRSGNAGRVMGASNCRSLHSLELSAVTRQQ
jgi:hypothetical protein